MFKQALLVGDDTMLFRRLSNVLGAHGYAPTSTSRAADAIVQLGGSRFDLCVVDFDLPAGEAAAVVMKARACQPAATVLALSACGSVAGAVEALRAGAADVVSKPLHPSALEAALERLSGAGDDDVSPAPRTPGMAAIGDHPAMRLVLERVERIADTDASVLVRGETGTGKEVIARLVHAASPRRARAFVAVNVAAIPESLAEAELFGHVRGAFTGADRARAGRLAAAEGGTLFFDEIGDLPRSVQAKLLRVLQDREVVPVGGGAPVPIDVRVIAATQHDLEAMVADGRFRADLYYRLAVVPLDVPPLRARRADIPALIEHFRSEVNAREGRRVPAFSADVMQRLTAYDWPGNVRELENVVERLVVVAGTRMVTTSDLPAHLRTPVVDLERDGLDLPARGLDLPVLLEEIENRLILEALARSRGDRGRAADLLRLNRTTLVEKLRRRNVA